MRCRPALQRRNSHPDPRAARSLRTQQRAYEPVPRPDSDPRTPEGMQYWEPATRAGRTGQRSTLEHHPRNSAAIRDWTTVMSWARLCTTPHKGCGEVLLRKEVIQPHLPVRLPCYDFVPIADPAFDGSLHKGWATGFGRYRLS